MKTQLEQVELFKTESWEYFQRNYGGRDLRQAPTNPYLARLLDVYDVGISGGAVLDVGCTPGINLHQVCTKLGVKRGVGTEPSSRVVAEIAKSFPEYEFFDYPSHALPFTTEEFDLVMFVGVLTWVDRNYFMQTLGEAARVTRRYLLVGDFAPTHRYSVEYHHKPGYHTFKMDYRPLIEASGFLRCVAAFDINVDDAWTVVRYSLFKKLDFVEAFPLRTQDELAVRRPPK